MYRHQIVPLDDSPLAVEVAHQAVKLVRMPRFSIDNDEQFRQLFARIVNLAHISVADGHERESA